MGRYRFVDPELERLPISDDDWVEVDKEVNFGDSLDIYRARSKGESIKTLMLMLRGWSFVDRDGETPIPIDEDTITNLDQDTAVEISAAVNAYHEQLAEEKKARNSSAESVAQ